MNKKQIIQNLFDIQAVKFGKFKLKSGIESPIYIDLRLIISYPLLLREIAEAMWNEIRSCKFDLICGVPYTALPIATALSLSHNIPMIMRRKEVKDYGTKKAIEGFFKTGQHCLIIEDLITSGSSILETVEPLQLEGLKVSDAVVLIDREQGGKQILETKGMRLHSVFNVTELLETLVSEKCISNQIKDEVMEFIFNAQLQ